jgi:hypothetical protein
MSWGGGVVYMDDPLKLLTKELLYNGPGVVARP